MSFYSYLQDSSDENTESIVLPGNVNNIENESEKEKDDLLAPHSNESDRVEQSYDQPITFTSDDVPEPITVFVPRGCST